MNNDNINNNLSCFDFTQEVQKIHIQYARKRYLMSFIIQIVLSILLLSVGTAGAMFLIVKFFSMM